MSLFSATLKQIGLPPWEFKASYERPACKDDGYYSDEAKAIRMAYREKATATIRARGPMDTDELAAALEVDKRKASSIIGGLSKSNVVERIKGGRYRLVEAANA